MAPVHAVVTILAACAVAAGQSYQEPYYGSRVGKFSTHFHDVKGDVYAVDERSIFIRNFSYDGKGVDTFFWAGSSIRPDASGFIIPDEKGTTANLRAYNSEDIVLRLPQGKRVKDIRWFAVWSRRFRANFGSLIFPKTIQPPKPASIGRLENTQYGVSSGNILILDTQTFLVENFSYDGTGKGAYWWLSRGMKPNTGGIQLLDENHSGSPLRKYIKETVVVSVPEGHTVFDYDTLSVWSSIDVTDYGMVKIPKDVRVPPSARSIGINPENKLNCEMLNDNLGFEARWVIEDDQLIMQLIGNLDINEYMALGFSKDDAETKFTSADAVIAWISPDGQGHAVDYFLQSTEKCEDGQGMCPDTAHEGADNSITLLNAAKVKDSITVTFKRSLKAVDEQFDQNIYTDGPQAVLWAVGPVSDDGEPGPPKLRTRGNLLLDFGRQPMWNCPLPGDAAAEETTAEEEITFEEENIPAFKPVAKVHCPTDLTFRAQLGPSNKDTGPERVWYINGLSSPDLTVQRGQTYTFIVEGGDSPPSHNPLYITSSEEGGLYQKILEANEDGEAVYAGVTTDGLTGALLPTAEGRLCEWTASSKNPEYAVLTYDMETQPPLFLNCGSGDAGVLSWTPDVNTSDEVYYQSFTQKNLGGRIRVLDFCEETDLDHYMQESHRGKDSHINEYTGKLSNKKSELEREDDDIIEKHSTSNIFLKEKPHPEPVIESEFEDFDSKVSPDKMSSAESVSYLQNPEFSDISSSGTKIAEERIINHFENVPNDSNAENKQKLPSQKNEYHEDIAVTQSTLDSEISESVYSIASYPYDESERSDTNILDLTDSGHSKHGPQRPIPLGNFQSKSPQNNINRNAFDGEQKITKAPPGFNVQFEGGFVPLVLNSAKEKESSVHPDYVPPPPHLRRPPRPFLFNESIPFHGTFKPGVPDFSGFNISHYTQDATMLEPNHLADHISLLTAPKPQIIQKTISPMSGLPHELFRRPHAGMPRPQILGYGPRPQMMHLPGHQQPLLFQLPPKPQPNFIMPPHDDDDLDEVSSQRVQISLQSPNEKHLLKDIVPGIPLRQPNNRNRQHGFLPQKLIAPSPPIQRRPDVVDEDDANYQQQQQRPQHSGNIPNRKHPENDKQQLIHQRLRGPVVRRPHPFKRLPPGGIPGGYKNRPPLPVPQRHLPDATGKHPAIFVQRPSAPRPFQQETSLQDNPFVYRLPNRPTVHLLKRPPQTSGSIGHHSIYPPVQTHSVSQDSGDIFTDKSSSEILDDGVTSYEILPPQSDEEKSPLQKHNPMPSRPHSQQFFTRLPPHFPINSEDQNSPSYTNIERLNADKASETNNFEKEEDTRPSLLKPYTHSQEATYESQDNEDNQETDDKLNHKYVIDSSYVSAESNADFNPKETVILQNDGDNAEIISVDKEESQEIHLPPFLIQNTQDIMKHVDDDTENQNPSDHYLENDKLESKYEFSTPPLSLATKRGSDDLEIATENPKHIEHLSGGSIHNKPTQHAHENVPFGARLNIRPQEEDKQLVLGFQSPQRPSFYPSRRQPQFSPPAIDANRLIKTTKRPEPPQKDTSNHYFRPSNSNFKDVPSKEHSEYIPKPPTRVGGQELLSSSTHPGRKNILPTDSNNFPHIDAPPKVPENIKLPEISEKPPTHDNGTDYSILSHVLSLIGGQPQPTNVEAPRRLN